MTKEQNIRCESLRLAIKYNNALPIKKLLEKAKLFEEYLKS
jgi:hypothetical protein